MSAPLTWMDVADFADLRFNLAPADIGDGMRWTTGPDGKRVYLHSSPDDMIGALAYECCTTPEHVRAEIQAWVDAGREGSVYGAKAHADLAAKSSPAATITADDADHYERQRAESRTGL